MKTYFVITSRFHFLITSNQLKLLLCFFNFTKTVVVGEIDYSEFDTLLN